jgi:acyl-homoserine lactone acylase PvdQ
VRALVVALAALAIAPAGARADYWSLLGIGQGQTANALDFTAATATGEPPATFVNQRELFNALLAPPAVDDLARFFKPAPIDPPAGAGAPFEPRPGVTIVRDAFNVPYVTGATRADTWFGAGYAVAQDRLFLMDVLRHSGRSKLTELAGPGSLAADAAGLVALDYDEEDFQTMLDRVSGAGIEGREARADLDAYVAGINAYIAAARNDPNLMPAEYALLDKPLRDWTPTDSMAVIALINGYFGLGGGKSAEAAMALGAARQRFGLRRGRRVLADFRALEDPEAPVTTTRRFPFDSPGKPRAAATAMLDPGSYRKADPRAGNLAVRSRSALGGFRLKHHASNAMVITGRRSESGNPLMVAGPQVDFYSPEIFSEFSVRGPGIAARGVGLPGVGPYVLIGRGRGFTWSITTAQGDLADEFAEQLCEPDGSAPTLASTHYRYRGACRPFERRERVLRWKPGPADLALDPSATAQTYTLRTQLSVHGPVIGHATVRGRPVAITFARSTYGHDAETSLAFRRLNQDGAIRSPRDFQRAIGLITGTYNVFYADSEHAAYMQSGWFPRRARGTDPTLPAWGTGRYDWQGFDERTFLSKRLPFARLPKDVDPARGYLISWNNKQAPGWRASDADWEYGPVHRSQRLERRVRAALRGGGRLSLKELVAIMGDAGTVDLRGQEVLPWLLRVVGKSDDPAVAALRAWHSRGAHRRDADGDGFYEDAVAVAVMDAWFEPMVRAVYEPVLGSELVDRIAKINQIDYTPMDGPDTWFYGWLGYVQKDLRQLLGTRVRGKQSRVYCGRGSRSRCRAILLSSLATAREAVVAKYGSLDAVRIPSTCPITDPPSCDQLDFIAAGGVETPPIPWQDRGTFQQAAEPGG